MQPQKSNSKDCFEELVVQEVVEFVGVQVVGRVYFLLGIALVEKWQQNAAQYFGLEVTYPKLIFESGLECQEEEAAKELFLINHKKITTTLKFSFQVECTWSVPTPSSSSFWLI